jgi:peptidylprolyl isomerase
MNLSRLLTLCLLALALLATGCGGGKTADIPGGGGSASTPAAPATPPTPSTPAAPPSPKPTIAKPKGPPPKTLKVIDLKQGTGPAAKSGDQLTVNYVGVVYKTGKQFDASYDSGQPFPFQLGGGQVIPGWDKGVAGMKVGGRRQLIIPPALAYGAQGSPPKIPPNAALIFDIDLLKIG